MLCLPGLLGRQELQINLCRLYARVAEMHGQRINVHVAIAQGLNREKVAEIMEPEAPELLVLRFNGPAHMAELACGLCELLSALMAENQG